MSGATIAVCALVSAVTAVPNASAEPTGTIVATVTNEAIRLQTTGGRKITQLRSGVYTVLIRDRSRAQNFYLVQPPVIVRRTTLRFVGSQRWTIRFARGVYLYGSDGTARLRGSFRVT
jgi:hypothetical protein